jgi:hypothetical protein
VLLVAGDARDGTWATTCRVASDAPTGAWTVGVNASDWLGSFTERIGPPVTVAVTP